MSCFATFGSRGSNIDFSQKIKINKYPLEASYKTIHINTLPGVDIHSGKFVIWLAQIV